VLGLLDDIQVLQPTIFVSVPRLWNRIHDRVAAVRAPRAHLAMKCRS
jgi:long-subunit acyl-CoA synthetase (AMP-forming)